MGSDSSRIGVLVLIGALYVEHATAFEGAESKILFCLAGLSISGNYFGWFDVVLRRTTALNPSLPVSCRFVPWHLPMSGDDCLAGDLVSYINFLHLGSLSWVLSSCLVHMTANSLRLSA